MSLTEFAPVDVTFQVAKPAVPHRSGLNEQGGSLKLVTGAAQGIADRIRVHIDGVAASVNELRTQKTP